MAPTQDPLYRELDLDLSWSERDLPERERTKHVHRLHPYLGKFVPQLVEALLGRYVRPGGRGLDPFAGSGPTPPPARARRSCRRSSRGTTPSASTSPISTACSCASRRHATTCSAWRASSGTPSHTAVAPAGRALAR